MDLDMDDDPEVNLAIPLKPVYEEFICPICFSLIEECNTTICGHSFCGSCIRECLNRKHQCPCCNKETNVKELFKNLHADRLIAIVKHEKEKSSKAYFEALLAKGASHPDSGQVNSGGGAASPNQGMLSPIERVFHTHMKKSLLSYEEYYKSLRQKFEKGLDALKDDFTQRMVKAKEDNKGAAADAIIAELKDLHAARRAEMEQNFSKTEQMLMQSYENYLKDIVVTPQFLPCQMTITISKRDGIRIPIVVKPTDTSRDIKVVIQQYFEKIGDPIKEFNSKNYLVLKRPFGGRLKPVPVAAPDAMDVDHDDVSDIKIKDDDVPILTFKPEPASILCLRGKLQTRSEEPKKCFKSVFDPLSPDLQDYFTCKTCKLNWICKCCAETCHSGHEVVIYLKQHKPTWACCYCFKSNHCKLFKK